MSNVIITQDYLKSIFDYRDGELYSKVNNGKRRIGDKCGSINSNGYLQTRVSCKSYVNHRLIFLMHYGFLPKCIDHIDNNRTNNKIENLRPATISENGMNQRIRSDNTAGVKNVYFNKRDGTWQVQITLNGKKMHFGYYKDIDYAKFVADAMRYKFFGKFARSGHEPNNAG